VIFKSLHWHDVFDASKKSFLSLYQPHYSTISYLKVICVYILKKKELEKKLFIRAATKIIFIFCLIFAVSIFCD